MYRSDLLSTTSTGRPVASTALSAASSVSVTSPSSTNITRSERPATSLASDSRSSPPASSSPGVSIRNTPPSRASSHACMLERRVSPCTGLTEKRSAPISAFSNDDLPVLTRPNADRCRWPCSSLSSMALTAS